jgi:hypothetical protein
LLLEAALAVMVLEVLAAVALVDIDHQLLEKVLEAERQQNLG